MLNSDKGRALEVLRAGFPKAEIVGGWPFEDGGGAIVQFYQPGVTWGAHGTIIVRWDAGTPLFAGHYFDVGFDCDVDYHFRVGRGY
jgi:hypothetical protein